eukprot:scaffold106768_cov22-Tisochrysis_lutea.AAC.1
MARRYDSRTTIFSPEGRLYQVEYAMEAISNAGATMGALAKDGVVLVAEKKITSKVRVLGASPRCLLDSKAVGVRREKMYKLDDHIACSVAGITDPCAWAQERETVDKEYRKSAASDANILINMCRLAAQRYHLAFQEPMPVEQLVQAVCDTKQ